MAGVLLAVAADAATAQGVDPKTLRGPLRSVTTMKALGPVELVEGPVAYGKIIFTQKLAYAMPGVMKTDLTSGKSDVPLIKAGTAMYGLPSKLPDGKPMWCTQPVAGNGPLCVALGQTNGGTGYYLFAVGLDAAVEGPHPVGTLESVSAPDVEATDATVDSGYRLTFAMKHNDAMEIERRYWQGEKTVVTQQLKLSSRHDIVFSTTGGEALYVSYDAAKEGFTAKRYATEAEAMAQ
jgi:hypothetical protein